MNYVSENSNSVFISSSKPNEKIVSSKRAIAIEDFVRNHNFVVSPSSKKDNSIEVKAIEK